MFKFRWLFLAFLLIPLLSQTTRPSDAAESPSGGNQPIYLFLFTHTEDHINHTLSEERYTRLAPEVATLAQTHPDAGLVWTIEFQGADAQTLYERNPSTGIVDMLTDYAAQGVIAFGYHGQHDPTYINRPQAMLGNSYDWQATVEAFDSWVSCEKDPLYGGCVAASGGGLQAVQNYFGAVQIVTGLGVGDNLTPGGAGRHAVIHHLPDYVLSFGFSDHAPNGGPNYDAARIELMDRLTPTGSYTTGGLFWMDDAIRINDGDPLQDVVALDLTDGTSVISNTLAALDRSVSVFLNVSIASKYIYTADGTSPTQWAYSHPTNPTLPLPLTNPPAVIESRYENSISSLDYLVAEFLPANPGSRFVGPEQVVEMATPTTYTIVSAAELNAMAEDLIANWGDTPPDFVTDGSNYYSLRDLMGLLGMAMIRYRFTGTVPAQQTLPKLYGPLEVIESSGGATLSRPALFGMAWSVTQAVIASYGSWQTVPNSILPSDYYGAINSSEALYGLAAFYTSLYDGVPATSVTIPPTAPVPTTYNLLETLGCWSCAESAWSLKPAVLYP